MILRELLSLHLGIQKSEFCRKKKKGLPAANINPKRRSLHILIICVSALQI